jgi:hypothetical protein
VRKGLITRAAISSNGQKRCRNRGRVSIETRETWCGSAVHLRRVSRGNVDIRE